MFHSPMATRQSKSLLTPAGIPAVSALEVLQPEPSDTLLEPAPDADDEIPIIQREMISAVPVRSQSLVSRSDESFSPAAEVASDALLAVTLAEAAGEPLTEGNMTAAALNVISQLYAPETQKQPGSEAAAASQPAEANCGAEADSFFRFTEVSNAEANDNERCQLRAELSTYIQQFKERLSEKGAGEGGAGDVVSYEALVADLMSRRRREYASLHGWMGPRKFEDLPVNAFAANHDDPAIQQGMDKIRQLDAKLTEKQLKLAAVERQTFPEKYAALDERRLALHSAGVEDALRTERNNRLKAARLARAFITAADDDAASDAGTAPPPTAPGDAPSRPLTARLWALKPEEEELVERLLAQDDEALLADNPFHVPAGPVEANLLMLPSSARGSRLPSTAGVTDASAPSTPGTASVRHTKSTGASAPSTAHAQAPPPTSQMPSTAGGSQSGAPPTARSQASASDSGGAAAASKVDYLRPQRLAREAAELERELDAQLRALQTAAPSGSGLSPEVLAELLEQARAEQQLPENVDVMEVP